MASKRKERANTLKALRIIRNRTIGELVARCIVVSAELHGCEVSDIVGNDRKGRGHPTVARARVVAMHACVALGVPMQTTGRAFRRTRRSVHSAIRIGRPGREQRDEEVLAAMRNVVARVKSNESAAILAATR